MCSDNTVDCLSDTYTHRHSAHRLFPHLLRALHERTDPVDVVQLVELGAEAVQSRAQLLLRQRLRLMSRRKAIT